jgi:hypothetical protein
MGEKANATSNSSQTTTTSTQTKPPARLTQEKMPPIPVASDFHVTRDKPYPAATDSGYKIYKEKTVPLKHQDGQLAGRVLTGPVLVAPDGQALGVWSEDIQKWVNPDGKGPVDMGGLKPDPEWFGDVPSSVTPPDVSGSGSKANTSTDS